jgi:hypothetical protein
VCVGSLLDFLGPTRPAHILVCESCPVLMDCLFEGLREQEAPGTWGGTSEKQRYLIRQGSLRVEEAWDENLREARLWQAGENSWAVRDALQAAAADDGADEGHG